MSNWVSYYLSSSDTSSFGFRVKQSATVAGVPDSRPNASDLLGFCTMAIEKEFARIAYDISVIAHLHARRGIREMFIDAFIQATTDKWREVDDALRHGALDERRPHE